VGNVKLSEFLVKAKNKTYATGGEERETVLGDGSKEFAYKEGMFQYRDRYLGFNPFVGGEVVWRNRELIWGMNYYGRIIPKVSASITYQFLREALRRVNEDRPFRGPPTFVEGPLVYRNETTGWIDCFTGTERILDSGREIYRLFYHGGRVKTI